MADKIDIKEKVKRFLSELGYTVQSSDDWLISFCIDKVENVIKNNCNISIIPNMLVEFEVDMVVGEFLMVKKNTGQLKIENISLEAMTKAISEGDTRVEFNTEGSLTDEQRLDNLIKHLLSRKGELSSYRCIKW